jgi:hypothetical protein
MFVEPDANRIFVVTKTRMKKVEDSAREQVLAKLQSIFVSSVVFVTKDKIKACCFVSNKNREDSDFLYMLFETIDSSDKKEPDLVLESWWKDTFEDSANLLVRDVRNREEEFTSVIKKEILLKNGLKRNDSFFIKTYTELDFELIQHPVPKTREQLQKEYDELRELLAEAELDDD